MGNARGQRHRDRPSRLQIPLSHQSNVCSPPDSVLDSLADGGPAGASVTDTGPSVIELNTGTKADIKGVESSAGLGI